MKNIFKIDILKFFKSFKEALAGFYKIFEKENTIKIEVFIGIIVGAMAFFLPLNKTEKLIVLLLIFLVIGSEILNTIIEDILDFLHPNQHNYIREIKQKMASFVLWISIAAFIIGVAIFIPYILNILK